MRLRPSLFYVTMNAEKEATQFAKKLVAQKLAACVNILPVSKSIYLWKDEIEESKEVILLIKAKTTSFLDIESLLIKEHSYDCPCLFELKIDQMHAPFLNWLNASVI